MPSESGVPSRMWRGPPLRLTRPWRSSTAWMVLLAGTRTSPSSRRTRSSRILRAPQCGFSGLSRTIRLSTLLRQLIGVAHRPPRAVRQGLQSVFLVPVKDLVAGLARDPELPAHVRHGLTIEQAGHKPKPFFHHRTRFPRHPHLPQNKSGKCNPCVRYEMSPMSRVAQFSSVATSVAGQIGSGIYHWYRTTPLPA